MVKAMKACNTASTRATKVVETSGCEVYERRLIPTGECRRRRLILGQLATWKFRKET